MRRILAVFLALCLCLGCGLTALAAEGEAPYANAGELYESWYRENPGAAFPYPDWICGVVSMDGTMERLNFYVLDDTPESEKEALLALVRDKSSVAFVEGGRYSIAELLAIQEELGAVMADKGEELGFWGMGINETANCLVLDVDTAAPGAADFIADLAARYGDRVRVNESGDRPTLETTTTAEGVDIGGLPATVNYNAGYQSILPVGAETPRPAAVGYWPLVAAVAAAGVILFLLLRKKAAPQPADGPEGGKAKPKHLPAPLQVEAAVMTAVEEPDERLREAIQKRIQG